MESIFLLILSAILAFLSFFIPAYIAAYYPELPIAPNTTLFLLKVSFIIVSICAGIFIFLYPFKHV